MANILAFSGSTREGSFNKKILKAAVKGARDAGASVTVIDLADFALPLYDGDLEAREGLPAKALALRQLFLQNQGLLLALPEYNSSLSAVFKNAIDWVSRPTADEAEPLACFRRKVAALISASPGELGGSRGLVHARAMLENIHIHVLPKQVSVPCDEGSFNDYDELTLETTRISIERLGYQLANTLDEHRPVFRGYSTEFYFTS